MTGTVQPASAVLVLERMTATSSESPCAACAPTVPPGADTGQGAQESMARAADGATARTTPARRCRDRGARQSRAYRVTNARRMASGWSTTEAYVAAFTAALPAVVAELRALRR